MFISAILIKYLLVSSFSFKRSSFCYRHCFAISADLDCLSSFSFSPLPHPPTSGFKQNFETWHFYLKAPDLQHQQKPVQAKTLTLFLLPNSFSILIITKGAKGAKGAKGGGNYFLFWTDGPLRNHGRKNPLKNFTSDLSLTKVIRSGPR